MPSWSGPIRKYAMKNSLGQYKKLTTNQHAFDFIHFRAVAQGISKWPQVLEEAYRCLKPGAYVELSEIDSKYPNYSLITEPR
jgi:ubiquinone/menaquinone biosynthesis C-methylase UbiE